MEIVVRFKTRAKQVSRPFYHERSVRDQGGEESSGSATASVETIHSLKPNKDRYKWKVLRLEDMILSPVVVEIKNRIKKGLLWKFQHLSIIPLLLYNNSNGKKKVTIR